LNEELVNLVKAFSVDSVLPNKSQRHRVAAAGWVISIFGYKWKALNMTKQKFVGTERDHIRVPGNPPLFTEYDVNFNIIPHTKKYIDLVWIGHEKQSQEKPMEPNKEPERSALDLSRNARKHQSLSHALRDYTARLCTGNAE
jgi:hypothetical protein